MNNSNSKYYVAYYRVSTKKQGKSGLGLESQCSIIEQFVKDNNGILVSSFTEVESGKKSDRKELTAAIQAAKKHNSILIVSTLDRLTRDSSFLSKIKESKVQFVCCDFPHANDFMIGVLALIAEYERKKISQRTSNAIRMKMKNGDEFKGLENIKIHGEVARQRSSDTRKQIAANNPNNRTAKSYIQAIMVNNSNSNLSLREIANILNENGYKTSKGNEFHPTSVKRLLESR